MSLKKTYARPYAKAVFEAAMENKAIPAWSNFLQGEAWIVQQPSVQKLLLDPRYTSQQRYEFIIDVSAPLLTTEEGKNFLKLLAENKRLPLLPEIAEIFEEYRIEQEKIAHVKVISAYPLASEEQDQLRKALKIKLQRDITLECQLDKSILGGLIIRAGDLVIDSSVRSKLGRLEAELIG